MTRDELIAQIDVYLVRECFEGVPKDANGAWSSWESASQILRVIEQAIYLDLKNSGGVKYYPLNESQCSGVFIAIEKPGQE